MAYGYFKDLNRRTFADKVLQHKAFSIAKNLKYDGYQRGVASMVYKFFDKKVSGSGIKTENISNKELAEELHKPIVRKLHSPLVDNIRGEYLADMQLISKFNKGFRFLLSVIDIYSKYACVIPLRDEKGIAITYALQKILKESNRKPNKIWVDKDSEFYNKSMKSWLEKNDIEMCSTNNEGKSVVPERLIRTLKNKIYKYMTSISKNAYINKLDDIVNKYNNTYHNIIKMKPVDIKSNTYIDSNKDIDDKNHKFKIGDIVRIWKFKNIFAKGYTLIGLKKSLWLKKLKTLFRGHMLLLILKEKKLLGRFTKTNCKTKSKRI